jgi:phosphoglycolate phosphatase
MELTITNKREQNMKTPFSPDDIDAIFFDLDGTLMDTDDLTVSLWERRLIQARLRPEHATTLARRLVMWLESPVNFAFTLLDVIGLDAILVRLMSALMGQKEGHIYPPVDGAASLVTGLAGRYRLGVVSTRSVSEAQSFLSGLGVDGSIETVVGRDSTWRIKPHPQPLLRAAEALGVPIERCLMVGDTTPDVRAARRAGAWSVAVLCGFGERPELERAGAHVVLDHTREVANLLA